MTTASLNDFKTLYTSAVTIASLISRNANGTPNYAAPVTYQSRVTYKNYLVRNAAGEQVVARGAVWILSNVAVSVDDQITLPDATQPQIISVARPEGLNGVYSTKIFFS